MLVTLLHVSHTFWYESFKYKCKTFLILENLPYKRIKESHLASLSPCPLFPHGCEEHGQLGLYNVCSKAELQPRQGFMVKSKSSETKVYISFVGSTFPL